MRVAVFGVGGVGGYFGARLAQSGEEVTFIARGEHLDSIREHGLRVDSILGDFVLHSVKATSDPIKVGEVDMVLLGVKAYQVETVLPALHPLVGPETTIVPLQNGVEAPDQIARVFGVKHVVGGLAKIISFKVGAGHICHAGADPYIAIGDMDKRPSERTERIHRVFQRSGISVDAPPDIEAALWKKFLFVVSWGGIGAMSDAPIGVIRRIPVTRKMLEQSMADIIRNTMDFVDTLPANGTTSLQRDIMDGYPSELDFWNGAVVRLGKKVGVETPLNSFIFGSLLPKELRDRGEISFPE